MPVWTGHPERAAVLDVLAQIRTAWRSGHPETMAPLLDENVVMAAPGFVAHVEGREPLIAGYASFLREARIHDLREGEVRVDGTGNVAVTEGSFEMVYEREGALWRATGWEVWVLEKRGTSWIAVWRTMQGVQEEPAGERSPG